MRTHYEREIANATNIQRTIVQGDAQMCIPYFGRAWKGMFPQKAAEELAARVGCTVRTAAYEISGERHPSAQSIKALVDLVVPKWG
jgi:hypothetical protein